MAAPDEGTPARPAADAADKAAIVARLQLEQAVRAAMATEEPRGDRRSRWLDSKLGLLVLGAIFTGILVPAFQYTGRAFESRRQDRFETLTARLQAMRESHRDLVASSAAPAEAYERARPFLSPLALREGDLAEYRKGMLELDARRFSQNARVSASLTYFEDRTKHVADEILGRYLGQQAAFFTAVDDMVTRRYCNTFPKSCGAPAAPAKFDRVRETAALDDKLAAMNGEYENVQDLLVIEVRRMEDVRAHFWF